MRKSSHWAHRQGKRAAAVAYGCYPIDETPNPNNLERDAQEVEAEAAREARKEAQGLIDGIRGASKGKAMLGKWEPRG